MVVGFQADITAGRQQIFEVEFTDEGILLIVDRTVFVPEVPFEYEAVLVIGWTAAFLLPYLDTVLAGPDICTELHFVGEAIHDTGYLGRKGG